MKVHMTSISDNLQAVRRRVERAACDDGRAPTDIAVLAVSKTWSAACVGEAADAGQRAFGESYVQEALDKIAALQERDLEWHFIGPLQSNKTRLVAGHFDWVHSVDRVKIARRLSEQRDVFLPPLNVCLQVNVSGEHSKRGVAPEQVGELAEAVAGMPRLALRGLMCIPEADADPAQLRQRFRGLRELRDTLAARCGLPLDTLSMGMSDDLEVAIAEGSTVVRVGSAIFGQRGAGPNNEERQ